MSTRHPRRPFRTGPLGLATLVLAVLVGTSGGAVAGSLVTGAQVKDGSLTGRDVRNGSLTGADLDSSTVTGTDVRNGSITSSDLADEAAFWGTAADNPVNATDNGGVLLRKGFTSPQGLLHVTATLEGEDDYVVSGLGHVIYRLIVDGHLVTGIHHLTFLPSHRTPGTVTTVVPVPAGPHTVTLLASEGGTGSVVYARELSIAYAPSGSSDVGVDVVH